MNYKEKIKIARQTGNGICVGFQEKANYKLGNGFDCPYCNSSNKKSGFDNRYETPKIIELMCNESTYFWVEDCKCKDCKKMFSIINGV